MALVGSISGSNSLIGISGSVIVANRPDASFPALPGADVVFFVSGSRESKGGADRTVSVFGGDTVISGNLTVGTGSVTITSNEIQFAGGLARIVSGSGGLTFFDSGTPSGVTLATLSAGAAGGDVDGPSDSIDNSIARFDGTTGKLLTGSAITIGDETAGAVEILGSATATTITLFNSNATTVNAFGGASTALSIGPAAGVTTIAGDLKVAGNQIRSSTGDLAIALTGSSVSIQGDLFVRGTTTTVSSTNLVISDPVVLIGSGSVGPKAAAVIAFSSGSDGTDDIIFGAQGGILRAAAYNTTGGNLPYSTLNNPTTFNTLAPIQASIFHPGTDIFLGVKSDGNNLIVSGSVSKGIRLTHGSTAPNNKISVAEGNNLYFSIARDNVAPGSILKSETGALFLTGSKVAVQSNNTGPALELYRADGAGVQQQFLSISSGSGATTNVAKLTAGGNNSMQLESNANVFVTASSVDIRLGSTSNALFLSVGNNQVASFTSGTLNATYNSIAQLRSSNASSALVISGSAHLIFGAGTAGGAAGFVARIGLESGRSGLFPAEDKDIQQFDLGAPTKRWANIYTGDLHLRNERGDYTLIEESDSLTIRYNRTGKRYRILVERAPEYDG